MTETHIYTETKLKARLLRTLREELPEEYLIWPVEAGYLHAGKPDVAILGGHVTSWLEIKLANPDIRDREIQRLTMKRAAHAADRVWYIIYHLPKIGIKETRIVEPKDRGEWMTSGIAKPGFDHRFVAQFLREVS